MLYNYNYGKLSSIGYLTYAPKNIQVEGTWYIPATEEQLINQGYLPIIDTPYPSEEGNYSASWEIQDGQIVKVWTLIPDTRTPAEKREAAYETKLCVVFPENSNDLITIDDGVKLVYEYSCENTEKAAEIVTYLKAQITEQKAIIREEYPDEE